MNNKEIVRKEQRTALLHVRIKASIYNLLMEMIDRREKATRKRPVIADILEDALRFSDGQIIYFGNTKIEKSKAALQKGSELAEQSKQLIIDHNKKNN